MIEPVDWGFRTHCAMATSHASNASSRTVACVNDADIRAPERSPQKNLSRERMQAELRHLREQAVVLEEQLIQLKRSHGVGVSNHDEDTTTQREDCRVNWQLVAVGESSRRRAAEAKNARLKRSLANQLHVIACLKRILRRNLQGCASGNSLQNLYPTFVQHIMAAYLMTDVVVGTEWMESTRDRSWLVEAKRGTWTSEDVNYLEVRQQWSADFEFRQTCEATWSLLTHFFSSPPPDMTIVESVLAPDSLQVQYRRKYEVRGRLTDTCVSFMMQRFIERDQEVRVWRTVFFTGAADDTNATREAFVDETGWSVYKRESYTANGEVSEGARGRTCSQMVPRFEEIPPMVPILPAGGLSSVVISTVKNDSDSMIEALANIVRSEDTRDEHNRTVAVGTVE